jgi:hypothetical protein
MNEDMLPATEPPPVGLRIAETATFGGMARHGR